LKTKQGVILAVEKRITSPLLEPSSVEKIMEIDEHIGCAMSGLTADARTLVEHGRVETQNHRFSYNEPMSVESTTQALCDLALRFGEGDEESMVWALLLFFFASFHWFTLCRWRDLNM
jgi:20S proteasome subunit alpha 5